MHEYLGLSCRDSVEPGVRSKGKEERREEEDGRVSSHDVRGNAHTNTLIVLYACVR